MGRGGGAGEGESLTSSCLQSLRITNGRHGEEIGRHVQCRKQKIISQSESLYDWRSFSLSVLVSSPVLGPWPDICYCLTITVLSFGRGAASLTRGLVCLVSESVNSNSQLSIYTYIYILHVVHYSRKYNIYKASVSPGQVQQIMPYF
jgi:hypothetical protein